mgnify:CR=1 FL=1
MSVEQVNAFMQEVSQDEVLQEKIISLPTDDVDKAIEQGIQIAKEAGFEFTKEQFLEYTNSQNNESELSDDDLEQVAGGIVNIGGGAAVCNYNTQATKQRGY